MAGKNKWVYGCSQCGLENGPYPEPCPEVRECYDCGAPVSRKPYDSPYGVFNFIPDGSECYNLSLGTGVRGRTHLKELQKKHGCQDYEPLGHNDEASHDRAKFEAKRARR